MVNQLSVLLTKRLPNLFVGIMTRKMTQRTVLCSSTLRALSMFPRNINAANTKCLSGTTNKFTLLGESVTLQCVRFCNFSSVSTAFPLKEETIAHKTVQELLDIFAASKDSLEKEECIELLRKIARAVWHDDNQRLELQKIRAASAEGCSMFRRLLNHIADSVEESNLDDKLVSTILWSLERIGETNHRLFRRFDKGKIVLLKVR